MKKCLWLILIVCVLATCTLAVSAVSGEGTAVVYLDGVDGNDNYQGTTAGDAVLSLARAYELLNGGDGTIVIMNDLDVYTSTNGKSSSFSVKSGNVVYTSKDPESGDLYPATIFIRDNASNADGKDYLPVFTPTTFEYVTFDAVTNNSTQFVTGKSLTFGEGMTFLRKGKIITDKEYDQIVVRCGSASGKISASYTQKSGTISSVYGGNEWKSVDEDNKGTTINISGDSQILVRLECGGNDTFVRRTDMTISGNVYINTLNLTGFDTGNVGNSYITITGGTIDRIWGQRSENKGETNLINNNLSMTISGDTTFSDIDLSNITISGTATLSISDLADDLTFTEFDNYWSNIIIGDNVKLHLDGAYPLKKNSTDTIPLSVGSNSILYLSPEHNTAAPSFTGAGQVVLDNHSGHELTHVEAFCGENGMIEHYRCDADGCPSKGNCYADAAGLTPVSKESTKAKAKHSLSKLPVVCTHNDEYYQCSVCGVYFADKAGETQLTEDEYLTAAGHKVSKVAVKAPTCVEDGVLEAHWHCEYCNWNFKDEAAAQLIKYSIIDPKTGHHDLEPVDAKAPTCTADGYEAHYACTDCGKMYTSALYFRSRLPLSAEQIAVKARHTLTYVEPVAATDTAHGTAGYWTCKADTCANYGKRFADEAGTTPVTDADLVTHKLTKVDAKAATATEPGNKEYWICASCDKVFADAEGKSQITLAETVIHATGSQTPDDGKTDDTQKPDDGKTDDTQKPAEPDNSTTPNTGDGMTIVSAALLMLLNASGAAVLTVGKKRGLL